MKKLQKKKVFLLRNAPLELRTPHDMTEKDYGTYIFGTWCFKVEARGFVFFGGVDFQSSCHPNEWNKTQHNFRILTFSVKDILFFILSVQSYERSMDEK